MNRRTFLRHTAAGSAVLAAAPLLPRIAFSNARGVNPGGRLNLNSDWQFFRGDPDGAHAATFDDPAWDVVALPHTARVEALVTGPPGSDTYQWQGISWYRKELTVGPEISGKKVYLKFEGAMNVADVWLNEEHIGQHLGGYLPFGFDVTERIRPDQVNVIAVRLDNTDNPITGPKPLAQLDFNPYGGLYRDAYLLVKDSLHITDPIIADKPASGGVFIRYPDVTVERAQVWAQTHVRNDDGVLRRFQVRSTLRDADDRVVAQATSPETSLEPGRDIEVVQSMDVHRPALWTPQYPNLHTLTTEVVDDGRVVDEEVTRLGIRRISISSDGFRINGERMFLRGTNRHQEYPYVGYAISNAAQYRDARKIKDAGFDYVRLSHYPHDPAFMDACDELGLVVMDCIPGWQFFNEEDPAFTEIQYRNCRDMMRRDRNHPCVILWEVSLNESRMPEDFIRATHALAHEEYPGDQTYTCGWQRGYDVFIQARQHGGCTEVSDIPCVVSEYGDWEYYAQNAGLNQEAWADLSSDEANSRQLRWHGERAMLQQATNFQEAHNDNLKTAAFADGLWVMFDYNRGYAPDIESSGCMDLFRLPKFSYYFFQSQRDAREQYPNAVAGPMVFIANYWTPDSPSDVRVFSNCDEVALHLNGRSIARRRPDHDRISTHLAHPPFTFSDVPFEPGTLEALAFLDGAAVARHEVRTPGPVRDLSVELDLSGRRFGLEGKDVAFVHASLTDAHGTVVPEAWENVFFGTTGDVQLIGVNPVSSEAGIAGAVLQTDRSRPDGIVYALALVSSGGVTRVLSAGAPVGAEVLPHAIHYSTDGSTPDAASTSYVDPIPGADRVRAVLLVGGEPVVYADSNVLRYRLAGSTAPQE